jgi:hypothetical protein
MKLLLTSAGFSNQTIAKAFLELAGKPFKEMKLAFIPTAANVEEGDKGWLIEDLANCKKLGLAEIDIVDISALPREIWQKRLEAADIFNVQRWQYLPFNALVDKVWFKRGFAAALGKKNLCRGKRRQHGGGKKNFSIAIKTTVLSGRSQPARRNARFGLGGVSSSATS